jgi:outer membrane protein assembly factor BamA
MLSLTLKSSSLFILLSCFFLSHAQDDTTTIQVIQEIKVIGNKTTKEKIILRELPFKLGDEIPLNQLNKHIVRAKSNLLNTLLFNFVTVDLVHFDKKNVSVYILVEERWYWWPTPILEIQETNFNTWWQDKDFERINYGFLLVKENFRGRRERVTMKFQGGYTEQARLTYNVPYINKKQTHGLNFKVDYRRNHELTYATTNNIRDFYRTDDQYVKTQYEGAIGYDIRPKLYNKHSFEVGYKNVSVIDTISQLNSDYLSDGKSKMEYFSVNYVVKRDKRNFKSYPTLGFYYDFGIFKNGLGVLDKKLNHIYISSNYRKYWEFSNRLYFSAMVKTQITAKEGPYYLYRGLGYFNNLVRGYELYVINGEHYGLTKFQMRYGLVENKVFKLNAIKYEKFNKIPLSIYLGTYFDSGYVVSGVNQRNNFLTNTTLYGGGISIDFVSYYDMVLRTEYSINKLGEHGLYLHFLAPI